MNGHRRLAAALRLVPRDWRDSVARDLSDEPAPPSRLALRAASIGLRLRLARTRDGLSRLQRRERKMPMREFTRDLRLAIRGAVRRPGYSLAVIATLAIGIGANTAIYSIFNWVLFRPTPGARAPSELVTILFQTSKRYGQFFVSYRDVADLRDGVSALSSVAASTPMTLDVAIAGPVDPERLETEVVTANYFALFGSTPAPGRDFTADEERSVIATPPVIISRSLWERRFGGSPEALGRTLTINGHAFTIVGVAPASFQGRSLVVATDLWIPLGAHDQVLPNQSRGLLTDRRNTLFLDAFGRLRSGATLAVAQQQASAVARTTSGFARRAAASRDPVMPVLYEGIGPGTYMRERLTTIFRLLMSAVCLVLLVACANAANLLLARSLGRRREIAVCQAIGASRLRIVQQQLAEGLVLAAAAGLAGLGLAILLTAVFDGMRLVTFLPAVKGVTIDIRVVAFTLAVSLATGLFFAAAPAFASSRVDLNTGLKDGLTVSRRGRPLLRGSLAVAQVAISVLLLVCASLFVRTLRNMRSLDLGLRPEGVVSFSVNPPRQGYSDERASVYFRTVVERLRTAPGVQSAAYSLTTPFLPGRSENAFFVPGDTIAHAAPMPAVSRGFFSTLGIPLIEGRDFDAGESLTGTKSDSVIVSRNLARMLRADGHVVGSRLTLEYPKGRTVTIIGVAGDVRGRPITDDPEPYIYGPASTPNWGVVHVRSSAPLADTVATIRRVTRESDPAVLPYDIEPFSASVDRTLAEPRLFARLGVAFALVAVVLAGIGIYGMMACAVGERMREFGIRLALGAHAPRLLALVLRSALGITAVGLTAGVAAASGLTRILESRLYGVSRHDLVSVAGGCAVLLLVSLAASALPALRASRVDPVRSLRVE